MWICIASTEGTITVVNIIIVDTTIAVGDIIVATAITVEDTRIVDTTVIVVGTVPTTKSYCFRWL